MYIVPCSGNNQYSYGIYVDVVVDPEYLRRKGRVHPHTSSSIKDHVSKHSHISLRRDVESEQLNTDILPRDG